jgi:hypothetical protein
MSSTGWRARGLTDLMHRDLRLGQSRRELPSQVVKVEVFDLRACEDATPHGAQAFLRDDMLWSGSFDRLSVGWVDQS